MRRAVTESRLTAEPKLGESQRLPHHDRTTESDSMGTSGVWQSGRARRSLSTVDCPSLSVTMPIQGVVVSAWAAISQLSGWSAALSAPRCSDVLEVCRESLNHLPATLCSLLWPPLSCPSLGIGHGAVRRPTAAGQWVAPAQPHQEKGRSTGNRATWLWLRFVLLWCALLSQTRCQSGDWATSAVVQRGCPTLRCAAVMVHRSLPLSFALLRSRRPSFLVLSRRVKFAPDDVPAQPQPQPQPQPQRRPLTRTYTQS